MTQAFIDYFRCPASLGTFEVSGELRSDLGFFRFGQENVCYGRCTERVADSLQEDLRDVLAGASVSASAIRLPFDVNEGLENLRRQRYCESGRPESLRATIIKKAYYLARPVLPVAVRKHLQKLHLRGSRNVGFPRWPIDASVDGICDELMALCIRANGGEPIPFVWFWPEGYPSCAIVTHDVEHEPGHAFCAQLMDIDDAHGIKSSFQLVPEKRYSTTPDFVDDMRSRGFEVNVHDFNHDGHLFNNRAQFLERAEKINACARRFGAQGFRAGAMYRNADWFDALSFSYDMSVPNAAHLEPQHGGCCTLMPYFIGQLVELPLTATQDYSLFHILTQYSTEIWKEEIRAISGRHGLVSFIVHPDYIIDKRARQIYVELLEHLAALKL